MKNRSFYPVLFYIFLLLFGSEDLLYAETPVSTDHSETQSLGENRISLIGLYPTGFSRPESATSPLFIYEYKSSWITLRSATYQIEIDKLNLKDWPRTWSVITQSLQHYDYRPGDPFPNIREPFFLRCMLSYQGALYRERLIPWYARHPNEFPLTIPFPNEKIQNAIRPEVLLVPAQGISNPGDPPKPSWFQRLWGAKTPKRSGELDISKPNVVMILVDTLRADHTPPGGHPFLIAPHIEELASLGVVFSNSYGASSSTRPSVGSIFTGLQPVAHGAVRHASQGASLHYGVSLLANTFLQNGYQTVAISSNAQISPAFGFNTGFTTFESSIWESQVTPRGIWHLRNLDEPFFLYLHYMAPHQPYEPLSPWKGLYEGMTRISPSLPSAASIAPASHALHDAYAEEITQEDHNLGLILKELSLQGLLDHTLIWLVSDHGEEFWEHWWNGHGATVFEESVRTLSVLSYPTRIPMGKTVSTPIGHVDMYPTLTDLLGWETPPHIQGHTLLPFIDHPDSNETESRPIFLHHGGGSGEDPHPSDKEAVLLHRKKLVWWTVKDLWELYDLDADPFEQNNLVEKDPQTVEALKPLLLDHVKECRAIAEQVKSFTHAETPQLSPEEIENLKAHGYVH